MELTAYPTTIKNASQSEMDEVFWVDGQYDFQTGALLDLGQRKS